MHLRLCSTCLNLRVGMYLDDGKMLVKSRKWREIATAWHESKKFDECSFLVTNKTKTIIFASKAGARKKLVAHLPVDLSESGIIKTLGFSHGVHGVRRCELQDSRVDSALFMEASKQSSSRLPATRSGCMVRVSSGPAAELSTKSRQK
jgi:hypothetical protein